MITAVKKEQLLVSIRTDQFEILSDVKPDLGGQDAGPNPHELVEGALAACTIMTVQMYAQRKQIPLENIHVEIKIPTETKEKTVFERKITFMGSLSDEEKSKLLEIANKCPIHRLLLSQIEIETTMVEKI